MMMMTRFSDGKGLCAMHVLKYVCTVDGPMRLYPKQVSTLLYPYYGLRYRMKKMSGPTLVFSKMSDRSPKIAT